MTYVLKVNLMQISVEIPYKYCVYTTKTINAGNPHAIYEYIYSTCVDIPADFANRVLKVPFGHRQLPLSKYYLFSRFYYFVFRGLPSV